MMMSKQAASWTPADLEPVLWLDAAAIQGLADNDPVAVWEDMAPAGNDSVQTDPAKQPQYRANQSNGLPSVWFAGTQWTASPASAVQDELTFACVWRPDILHDGTHTLIGAQQSGALHIRSTTAGAVQLLRQNTVAVLASTLSVVRYEWSLAVVTWSLSAQTATIRINGQPAGEVSYSTSFRSTNPAIGAQSQYGGNQEMIGDIAEVVLCDSALDLGTIDQIETYLMGKWL